MSDGQEDTIEELLSKLRSGEANYTQIYEGLLLQVEISRKGADENQALAESEPTTESRDLAMQNALILQAHSTTAFVGMLVARLGEDISQTHQRLAEVEKAVQELGGDPPRKFSV